jgi:imidazolonepropionase-like amidohydrolase
MKIKIIFPFILISIFLQSHAQTIYIKAGQVFDGNQFLGSRIIEINKDQIHGIFAQDYVIPDGAKVIDASNCTLLPGFIDSHIHFMGASMQYLNEIEKHSWGKLASEGISLFPEHRLHLLMNGVTSIIDMGSPLESYKPVRNALSKGKIIGPELYYPGPLFTAPKGHPVGYYTGHHDLISNGTFQVTDVIKAKKEVEFLATQKVDFIKIVYDRMWYTKAGAPRLDISVAKGIVDESHKLGLKVFAHVGSEKEALTMAGIEVDGIEHGFGTTSDSIFTELKDRNISFTPTLSAYDHYAPKALLSMGKTIKKASELDVPVVVGTDYPASYGEYCGDDIFKEMNLLEQIGVPRIEVLRGTTSYGARKIGKEKEIGSIVKGYRANLVLYEGNIDTGILTSSRIISTMLHGDIIVEDGMLVNEYSQYFMKKTSMIFPYGFYDMISRFNMGVSYTNFDILNSGISLYGDAAWSIRNMWSVNLQFFIPSSIKKTTIKTVFHFDNLNRLFYGIGNNTLSNTSIEYGAVSFKENISATSTWNKYWKLTYSLLFDQFKTSTKESTIPSLITGADGGNQTVVALSFIYDSRDHQNNPWNGTMISVTPEFSSKFLGSNNEFERLTFDARGYISPFPRNILCARLLYRQAYGDIPYYYLPDFGGSLLGRGYYISRFIDRSGIYGQAEYRFPVWKIISGVAFYDVGQVQRSTADFRMHDFHHSAGFGPRFNFGSNENSILGMDFGFSNEGIMIFFHAGHSF